MDLSILLIGVSFLYLILVAVLYYVRKNEEDLRLFKIMLGLGFFALVFDAAIIIDGISHGVNAANNLASAHDGILLALTGLIGIYVFSDFLKGKPMAIYYFGVFYIALIFSNVIVQLIWEEFRIIFFYSVVILSMVSWFTYFVFNFKEVEHKKIWLPLLFTTLFLPVMILEITNPEILIVSSFVTFIVVVYYHTLEKFNEKHLLNELAVAQEQIEKANFARQDFLTEMSHQIRTPLNAIVGYSQLIEKQAISDNIKEDVQNIKVASTTLLDLVDNIIDASKITVDELEIVNKKYNVQDLFNEVIAIAKERIGKKPIIFNVELDKNLPNSLEGDYNRLKQVMVNILTKAIKTTDEGEINFKVTIEIKDDDCRMKIFIEKSGIISNYEDDEMFAKYEKLNTGKFQLMEESNLNLAITTRLVELMGGSLIVNEQVDLGSQVTISINQKIIPFCPVQNLENIIHYDITHLNNADKRVLIVDDNKINLKVAKKLLNGYGLKTDEVFSGKECLEKINSGEQYDLILLDDMMPNMSGVETLGMLRKIKDFKTPVVALTAHATIGMREKYLAKGFNDYIAKPIEQSELEKVLLKFLKGEGTIKDEEDLSIANLGILVENGIDVEKAIQLLDGIDTYNETLADFLEEAPKKIKRLDEYRASNDMENYAILAHSFKTDAKYCGLIDLIDLAYHHELESKNNNLGYINDNFKKLNDEVERILKLLKKYLKDNKK